MNQLIKLIPATEDDYEFSYQLKKIAEGDYIKRLWGWDEILQRDFHLKNWKEKKPDIITYNGKQIGTISIIKAESNIKIGEFFILPEYQNKGIGSCLLKQILEKADELSLVSRLTFLKGNPVEFLYNRNGFRIVRESKTHCYMERLPGENRVKKANIFLQRHGESFNNIENIFTCRKLNPGLTENGRNQISEKIAYYKNFRINKIISSPSKRALQSSDILAYELGIDVKIDDNLLEVNVGDLEGKSENDPQNLAYFFEVIEKWIVHDENVRFPGGESKSEVEERLDNIKRKYLNTTPYNVVLVGHAVLFAVLLSQSMEFVDIKNLFLPRGGIAQLGFGLKKW